MNNQQHSSAAAIEQLAAALPVGIIVIDKQKTIQWGNAAAKQIFALTSEHNNQPISNILQDEVVKALFTADDHGIEIISPENKTKRLAIYLRDYIDEQKLLLVEDVTRTYRFEKMRQDFIANVSHELRTPLTVFHGYLEMLIQGIDADREKINAIYRQMYEQSERMERLVNDLLLLSRLESMEPDIQKHELVDVAHLLKDICEDAKSLSGRRQHQFTIELDSHLRIRGEPHELRSAFSNIIFNAVQYTPEKGFIKVRWYAEKNKAIFAVTDSGIGIAKKHIHRITQRFYRADKARSREQGGTGLGLAIVKHVLLRHHGELFIESEVDKGSTFRCCFDLRD